MRKSGYLIAASAVSIIFLLLVFYVRPWADRDDAAPEAAPTAVSRPAAAPPPLGPKTTSLYCQFYVFVESRPFVAFLFERAPDERPVYAQVYVVKADGDRTDYSAETGARPEWRFDRAADPPRLTSRIMVPDASQAGVGEEDVAIEVYGFDGTGVGNVWYEASLKSVFYQNLPGKCRQTAA